MDLVLTHDSAWIMYVAPCLDEFCVSLNRQSFFYSFFLVWSLDLLCLDIFGWCCIFELIWCVWWNICGVWWFRVYCWLKLHWLKNGYEWCRLSILWFSSRYSIFQKLVFSSGRILPLNGRFGIVWLIFAKCYIHGVIEFSCYIGVIFVTLLI